jgi:flagellar basal body P-ring formation protein FlgA
MTFKVWSVSLIFLTNVGPSISGIITSLINKSIFSSTSSNSFKAETPLSASYTLYPLFLSAIAVPDGSGNETLQTVTGRAIRVSTIPSLSRTIRNGDVIKESDIKWLTVPAAQVGNNMIRSKDQLIDMTPRNQINAESPIRLSDIQRPILVKRGNLVKINFSSDKLSLTTMGKAMESGGIGDVIRVINTTSNKTISAIISGPDQVEVSLGSNNLIVLNQ